MNIQAPFDPCARSTVQVLSKSNPKVLAIGAR
jgi:hypothetical protein